MKIEFVRKEGDEWEIKISGEDHTLLNLIQEKLLKDRDIEIAAYVKPHPLVDYSVMYLRTKKEAKKRFLEAAKGVIDLATEFRKEFKKARTMQKV